MNPWAMYSEHWGFYHSVTFDGPNKLILVNNGVTELNVGVDLYSDWKEWVQSSPDGIYTSTYLRAMRGVGGDPLPGTRYLGATFFLTNGWRIKPYSGSYSLSITGNLYTEEGETPFVDADGLLNNIRIESTVSTLVEGVLSPEDIASAVWDAYKTSHSTDETFGKAVDTITKNTGIIPALL